jgi:hypothetical protein
MMFRWVLLIFGKQSGIGRVVIPVPSEFPLKFFKAGDSKHGKVRPFLSRIQIFSMKSIHLKVKSAFSGCKVPDFLKKTAMVDRQIDTEQDCILFRKGLIRHGKAGVPGKRPPGLNGKQDRFAAAKELAESVASGKRPPGSNGKQDRFAAAKELAESGAPPKRPPGSTGKPAGLLPAKSCRNFGDYIPFFFVGLPFKP